MDNLKCPYCKEQKKIRRQGKYLLKPSGDSVFRYFCRGCNRSFSTHTNIYKDFNTMEDRPVWKRRSPSNYRKENREKLFTRIDDFLINQGITKVETILEKVGVGKSTYNRYLKELSSRFVSKFADQRKQIHLGRALLLELKTKFEGTGSPGRIRNNEIIRGFILFDQDSGIAFDFFLTYKKDPEKWKKLFGSTLDRDYLFGHRTTLPRVHSYLAKLKEESPQLQLSLDCSPYVQDFLLKKDSSFYRKALAKDTKGYWKDLEKVKIKRILRFRWTMLEKQKKPEPSFINFRSKGGSFVETMRTHLSIHNERKLRSSSGSKNKSPKL